MEAGFFESRAKAQDAIEAGLVAIDGRPARRASDRVGPGARMTATAAFPWVSRGGMKLVAALDAFQIDPRGRICLDVGASTGGFTDVLLSRCAEKVFAVDVGRDQLHPRLRQDARVVDLSEIDIRHLEPARLAEAPSLIVCDASFISLTLVVPPMLALAAPGADLIALIKPQFEVGFGKTHKGIVRDEAERRVACDRVVAAIAASGGKVRDVVPSPIEGRDGNREYLVVARAP